MIRYEENRNYIAECNFCGVTKKFKLPENNNLIWISNGAFVNNKAFELVPVEDGE